jgi:hypothetical protein
MATFPINYWAVLVAAAAKFVLGALWYSPVLFGPTWMRLAGVSEAAMKANLPKGMIADAIGGLVMAFVLLHAAHYAGAQGLAQGVLVGFFNWLGFIGVTTLSATFYEDRPIALFFVNNGYLLVALLIMGAIVTIWV